MVRKVVRGGPIYEKELLETKERSFAVLAFQDETCITMRPNTQFQVEEFSPEPYPEAQERVFLKLLKGGLRALTGLVAKKSPDNFKISTPLATIGIRGTGFDLSCNGDCVAADAALQAFVSSPSDSAPQCDSAPASQAAQALETLMRERGFTFHRVTIPPQTSATGEILLDVVSFKLAEIEFQGNVHFNDENLRRSLPILVPGTTPNARLLSRYVQAANEHPSKRLNVTVRQSRKPDHVDAVVEVRDIKPVQVFSSFNNRGSSQTGNTRISLGYQHSNLDHARARNKPVIVATQMLESMIDNPRPTRAEVTDVSHTAFSGADAIMLSAETATGAHPVLAVEMMNRIARQTEGYLWSEGAFGTFRRVAGSETPIPFGDAVARSTALLSRDLMVRAIVVISGGGMSATTVSSARPAAPVLAVSSNHQTCRRMNLMWGVIPVHVEEDDLGEPVALTRRLVTDLELANPGTFVLLVRGFHENPRKNTPSITLLSV